MFRVVGKQKYFRDLTDNHVYEIGDKFPFDDREIEEKRIKELLNPKNKLGYAVIEFISQPNEKKVKNSGRKN